MGFFQRLEQRVRSIDSLLCVGLDPHRQDLHTPTADAARDFCLRLIEETADLAAAFKPNAAFFEVFGARGIAALSEVIQSVPHGIPVILDAKRGDIASTAQAYAQAAFETLQADAITINPYLGYDAVSPFLRNADRGVFLLCKTSNPGAKDLQDLVLAGSMGASVHGAEGGRRLYERVAWLATGWNQVDNLGLVVGATQLDALARVRALAPDLWVLAPGVGAQGADLHAALQVGLRADGFGMLVPVSRGIARAEDARQAASEIRQAINQARETVRGSHASALPVLTSEKATLADGLLSAGCVKFGRFTLKSGLESPIYIDLRRLASLPDLLMHAARAYAPLLHGLHFIRLAALPYAALPIGTAVSLYTGWPMIYPRKETKAYGTRAEIEGIYQSGERVVVIDDLATTGGSKFEAIEKLAGAGLAVQDVVVLIDRESGAAQALAERGYQMHAVFTLTQLLDHWAQTRQVAPAQIEAVRSFLSQTNGD